MSNQILLATPKSVSDLGPFSHSVTLGQGWPTHQTLKVGSESKSYPITYLDKDVIEEGEYVHPKTGQKVHASRQQLKDWKRKFDEMHRTGAIEATIPVDHKIGAKDNLGFVKQAKLVEVPNQQGEKKLRLRLTHALIGEDAPLIAMRNRASIGIDPDYTDGKGKNWGSVIIHSAITPEPVVSGMGGFAPTTTMLSRGQQVEITTFLLSAQETSMTKLSAAHRQKLCTKMGMDPSDSMSDDDLMSKAMGKMDDDTTEMSRRETDIATLAGHFTELADTLGIEKTAGMKLADGIPLIKSAVKLARETANDAIELARASGDPALPDVNVLTLLGNSFETEFEAVVRDGGMSEAAAKAVKDLYMPDGLPNVTALSRSDGDVKPHLSKLLAILKTNKPVAANGVDKTGIQLHRGTVAGNGTPTRTAAEIRERMIARNNGTKVKAK